MIFVWTLIGTDDKIIAEGVLSQGRLAKKIEKIRRQNNFDFSKTIDWESQIHTIDKDHGLVISVGNKQLMIVSLPEFENDLNS